MKLIPIILIILLVLVLIIIYFIYYAYCHITSRVENYSMKLFGTRDITRAADKMRVENSTTPKSVSSMTSLCLPRIKRDFPEFNYDEMRERSRNVLIGYLRGISEKDASVLTDGTRELKQKLEDRIAMLNTSGLAERFDQVKIHETEIMEYVKSAGRCKITFQSSIECFHYITDETNNITEGSKDYKYQTKYNVTMIYIQDREIVENELDHGLGLNCPNCGAPITSLGHKHCAYCGTSVKELNIHVWTFSDVEELT